MESGELPNGWIWLVGGAPASNRGIAGRLRNHHAADGFSSVLLLPEEHEFALTASCRETGNDLAGDICRPYECVYQRVCNHKSGIFRKYTKRHTIINITARACFAWKCSKRISSVPLLPEEHEFALTASCRETGNDLAGNRYRPCECVYQHVCNHKNGIFCRNTKRPAVITQQGVV